MPKFHFRLETMLQLRQATRDQRRAELDEVRQVDAELHRRLCRLEQEQSRLQHQCRAIVTPGVVDVRRLLQSQQYAATLSSDAAELRRQRGTLADEIDRRRQILVEAERELQALEKLRENQTLAHRQAEIRQENNHLDEAALRAVGFDAAILPPGNVTAAPMA